MTSHSVDLTGLAAGTTYYYRVRSADPSGNATTSPAAAGAPAAFAVPATAVPAATVIDSGGGMLRAGNAGSLTADDNNFFAVNSTTTGTRTTSWHGRFTSLPAGLSNLRVSFIGKSSAACTQVLAAWRWTNSTWQQLDSRSVSTTEVAINDLSVGAAASFVSSAGEVRIRARCTRTANFFTSAEVLKLTYVTP